MPIFERLLVEDGIQVLKYWFSVSDAEQEARFRSRAEDPMRRWKLSPNDVSSITKWEDYSRAKDTLFTQTNIPEAPWLRSTTRQASRRINMIHHLLSQVPYETLPYAPIEIPPRPHSGGYERLPRDPGTLVPDFAAELERVADAS